MKLDKQTEAMALLDGHTIGLKVDGPPLYYYKDDECVLYSDLPDYDTDNELDRMVRGLRRDDRTKYWNCLYEILTAPLNPEDHYWNASIILEATQAKKREAFLKAKGEWTDEG